MSRANFIFAIAFAIAVMLTILAYMTANTGPSVVVSSVEMHEIPSDSSPPPERPGI